MNIHQVTLGSQGLKVPAIGLGCMGMSEFYGDSDRYENIALLYKAIELGCNFWDTADMYGPFTNEKLLGEVLHTQRDKVILASKFGIKRNEQQEWLGVNGRPDYVKSCCDASLKRLKTEYIDVYYQHRFDPEVPIEETVGAMGELVKAGKVKYLGLSEADSDLIRRAHQEHPISVLQTEYSLWSRDIENDILGTLRQLSIGFVAYSPLGRGFLSGAIQKTSDLQTNDWRLENPRFTEAAIQQNRRLVDNIQQHAQSLDITPAQLALAWVLAQGDDIAVIPGTRHEMYLTQNWQSQNIDIPTDVLEKLTQFSADFVTAGERY